MLIMLLLAAANSAPIEVGKFDPAAFPSAIKVDRRIPQAELIERADRIMKSGRCSFPGQKVDRYSITVPYAVLIEPSGNVDKLVVKEVGCPELELLTGQVANELAKARDFRPTKTAAAQWYVSEVDYAHGGRDLAAAEADDGKIVCEDSKPVTGSRLARSRMCLTKAQWRALRTDQLRLQQDMGNMGDNLKIDPPELPLPQLGRGPR